MLLQGQVMFPVQGQVCCPLRPFRFVPVLLCFHPGPVLCSLRARFVLPRARFVFLPGGVGRSLCCPPWTCVACPGASSSIFRDHFDFPLPRCLLWGRGQLCFAHGTGLFCPRPALFSPSAAWSQHGLNLTQSWPPKTIQNRSQN